MAKVSFTVSARTARLIGRENIASSKGAIIELVKNGYDADSNISIVYFDNKFAEIPAELSSTQIEDLKDKGITNDILSKLYKKKVESHDLIENANEADLRSLAKSLRALNSIYIIDAGEGMTQNIIRNHWMNIGTDNKALNIFTASGRVKAGAKGIGRFALDKLGSKCEMITVFDPENHEPDTNKKEEKTSYTGYNWKVNWGDFEGDNKTIDNVTAELNGINSPTLKSELERILPDLNLEEFKGNKEFKHGTILKISGLRDTWEDHYVQQVYSDLEVLIPPKESRIFQIYLYSTLEENKYGEVLGSVCDDFDYKIEASADKEQNVEVTVYRNEYDLDLMEPEFFKRERMQKEHFRKKDFKKGFWTKKTTFSKLLPGFAKADKSNVFEEIGEFNFSFYYMKRTYSSSDVDRFFYKKFMANSRKDWLDEFGGVKLFRDNFRVRPYGEINDSSFDWLALGTRKSSNPAGIAKKGGGWKVEPENVAGSIKISRLTNVNFEDKSSREGLQENKTFLIFKRILTKIITILEEDRAYIAREMDAYYNEKYSDVIDREKAENLAKSILEKNKQKKQNPDKNGSDNGDDSAELVVLAELNREKDEVIEKLKDEQKVLRGLASSGIVLASFSHDLSKLNNVLNSRVEKVKRLISEKIKRDEYSEIENRKNPFFELERMRKQDIKLQNWLNFSLGATRKDKRKRKQLFLHKYFRDLKADWLTILKNRGVKLDVNNIEEIDMRVFEIDFDSIFHNLLVNSIDAFKISKVDRARSISITASSNSKEIKIDYIDNGPGLSKDIENPDRIFEPLYTTKRNPQTGEEQGTGLGMWLVESISEENDGNVKLLHPDIGFGVRITFPVKYKRS